MDFDRDYLETMLDEKLGRAERSIVRSYLGKCGISSAEAIGMADEIISSRAQHNAAATAAELDKARERITELEGKVREQKLDFAVRDAFMELGVRRDSYDDVRRLAAEGINASIGDDNEIDCGMISGAVAEVLERIPALGGEAAAPLTTGSRGNFARNDDGASLMKNRLNAARAAGNNALSVSIISEASELGISLR